jgi:Plavaka transposase
MNDQEHRSQVQHLFHKSMCIVLEPLIDAGINGIEMNSSDGAVRKVHPILTCYVANYPEQCLVACTKYGTCPKCRVSSKHLEDPLPTEKRTQKWTQTIIIEGKNQANGNPQKFHTYCMSFDVAGSVYRPFWEGFPLCDIHSSITPDVLHQLYQGVLSIWLLSARTFLLLRNWTDEYELFHQALVFDSLKMGYLHCPKFLVQNERTWQRSFLAACHQRAFLPSLLSLISFTWLSTLPMTL